MSRFLEVVSDTDIVVAPVRRLTRKEETLVNLFSI